MCEAIVVTTSVCLSKLYSRVICYTLSLKMFSQHFIHEQKYMFHHPAMRIFACKQSYTKCTGFILPISCTIFLYMLFGKQGIDLCTQKHTWHQATYAFRSDVHKSKNYKCSWEQVFCVSQNLGTSASSHLNKLSPSSSLEYHSIILKI